MHRFPTAASVVLVLLLVAGCQTKDDGAVVPPVAPTASGTQNPLTTTSDPGAARPAGGVSTTSAGPAGGPVPHGFRPQSVTFVSAQDGWVLGTAPCSTNVCTSVVRTTDGGRTWTGIPAPHEQVAAGSGAIGTGTGLSVLRFADHRNGYAFGDHLWATTDGGAHWTRQHLPGPGSIAALATADGTVYVLLVPAGAKAGHAVLYRTRAGARQWEVALSLSLARGAGPGLGLVARAREVVLMVPGAYPGPGTLYRSADDGTHWGHAAAPCRQHYAPSGIDVAPDSSRVVLTCTGDGASEHVTKHVYVSTDAGHRFTRTAAGPPRPGDGADVAVPASGSIVVGSVSGAALLYGSFDGGAHWSTVFRSTGFRVDSGGQSMHDLGFSSPRLGALIVGIAAKTPDRHSSQLYLSRDGAHHWTAVDFDPPDSDSNPSGSPLGLGTAATFGHFRVTVGNLVRTPSQGQLVYASVCVRSLPAGSVGGKTRISWDPWRVVTSSGTYRARLYDGSHPPATMFPRSGRYAEGDCAFGYLPFSTATGTITGVRYHNGVEDAAVWSTPPNATRKLGTRTTLDRLSVMASRVQHDRGPHWYGAKVKICATSLPAGAPPIRVSAGSWTLSTDHGVLTQVITQEGAPSFGTAYPQTAQLTRRRCAAGWVGFPMTYYADGVSVTQVNFRDQAGREVSFSVGS